MNYRLYALIFALSLAASPALQAMRVPRVNSLLMASRALRSPGLQTGSQALARIQSSQSNDNHKEQFKDNAYTAFDSNFIPTAGAAAVGLAMAGQHEMEEEHSSSVLNKLNIYDIAAVLAVLKNGSEDDKRVVIDKVGQHIEKYYVGNVVKILQIVNEKNQEVIIKAIIHHIDKYVKGGDLSLLIKVSSEKNQELLYAATLENIDKFCGFSLCAILRIAPKKYRETFISAIAKNIHKNIEHYWGDDLSIFLELANEDNKKIITKAIIENTYQFTGYRVERILAYCNQEIKEAVINIINERIHAFLGQYDNESQSSSHLKHNSIKAWEYINLIMNNPKFKEVFQQALSHERSTAHTFAVFYHSQKNEVFWLELLYTKLWEQKYHQSSIDYLFTRFPDDQTEFANAILQFYGQEKRSILINTDEIPYEERNSGRRNEYSKYVVFTNYALLANSTFSAASSVEYFANNLSYTYSMISTEDIINKFGNQELFSKYRIEIEQLQKEFEQIISRSVLLQLCIPHRIVNNYVYLAAPVGAKKKLRMYGKQTDDVSAIVNTLKTNPNALDDSDKQEFCVVMTPRYCAHFA